MTTRQVIQQLAMSPKVSEGSRASADAVAARARQIDPLGDYVVEETVMVVNGMRRRAWHVINRSEDAGRVEFGRQSGRVDSDGRGGLRPLGRAARSAKG